MTESFEVAKLSGAGNDFVALRAEARAGLGDRFEEWVRKVCRRGLSLGADGVLVVEPIPGGARVEFFNPDSSAAFCGNGTRCAARWASVLGTPSPMDLETSIGNVIATVDRSMVTLQLPIQPQVKLRSVRSTEGRIFEGYDVEAGVPHYVLLVEDVAKVPLEQWGPMLRRHPDFGESGRNIDLLAQTADGWALRTWERGVEAETLACGSGAIAAAAALERLDTPGDYTLLPAGGIPLTVAFPETGGTVLKGEARLLWSGSITAAATEWF